MIVEALRKFFVNSGGPARVVAAVSGGVDSTALLLGLAELRGDGFEVVCAHVNHHLRGADSDADEDFVRSLGAQRGIACEVADGTLDAQRVRDRGIEAAAREVRYARLLEIRSRTNARFVATAHQKNDQAETVLMRLLTGSGIAGLRGIHPVREDGFVRPLLEVSREEIEAFLRERNVTPRFDRSNDDPRFLRNRVRALLRELGGIEPLANVAAQAREMWPLLERAIDEVEVEVTDHETRVRTMPRDEWLRGALLQRHIRRLDPDARDFDAQRIARDETKRISVTKNVELIREDDSITLRRRAESPSLQRFDELPLTPEAPAFIEMLGLRVILSRADGEGSQNARSSHSEILRFAQDDGARQLIQLPHHAEPVFTVRNRRPGDRFHPLGMAQPKKLKDFLIDRRIPADARDRLPLVLHDGEIVWIAGVEVSEKYKVTSPAVDATWELRTERIR
jgi:tRNA(Ile)-lysidine synthase